MRIEFLVLFVSCTVVWRYGKTSTFVDDDDDGLTLLTRGSAESLDEGSGMENQEQNDTKEKPHHLRCMDSVLTLQHKEYILHTHNRLRSKLAFGRQPNKEGMMGSGKNIYLLKWDCELEEVAHAQSKTCSFSTVTNSSNLPGSHLMMQFHMEWHGSNVTKHIDDAMRSWWTEYKRHGNVDAKNRYFSRQLYFSWANMAKGRTTRFGCSYSYCAQGFKSAFSCIYNETALCWTTEMIKAQSENQTIYEQGKPCEFDVDCSTFPRSQCVSSIGMCKAPLRVKDNQSSFMCNESLSTMTDHSRKSALEHHNFYRSRLAKGLEFNGQINATQTGASAMLKMAYDCDLEKYAQLWADNCDFKHSSRWERPEQGQNLYMTSFRSLDKASLLNTDALMRFYVYGMSRRQFEYVFILYNEAIEMWWKELEEYGIPADAILSEEVWNTKGRHIGHFTQMAWSDSHRLGCAITICSDMSFVVCHYSPAGNRKNHSIYSTGPHCTQDDNCPRGTFCAEDDGLCSLSNN